MNEQVTTETKQTDYEVFNHDLEEYFQALRYPTEEQAKTVARDLERRVGLNFYVRQVETGKEPIPVKAKVATGVTVHEARKLMATHGQDVLVTVAWSEEGMVNIATAGSSRTHSEEAKTLGDRIAAGLGLVMENMTEDRRNEHTT